MVRSFQSNSQANNRKYHPQHAPTIHPKTSLAVQIANSELELYQASEDDDSFDASSLIPGSSDSSNMPASNASHPPEQVSALHTFLHSNQNHSRHLHQLNHLVPSPAPAGVHQSSGSKDYQLNQPLSQSTSSCSASTLEHSSALQSWRMQISREGIPHTLLEETSEELRRSEISAVDSSHNFSTQDEASTDEDDCSTIYANRTCDRNPDDTTPFEKHSDGEQDEQFTREIQAEQSHSASKMNSMLNRPTTDQNYLHAMAESIGLDPTSHSQSWLPQSQSNDLDMHDQHPTNNIYSHLGQSLPSATTFTQSRASSFSSCLDSTKRPSRPTVRRSQTAMFDSTAHDTPPTSPMGGSESDEASKHPTQKANFARHHQQTALEATKTSDPFDHPSDNPQLSHHRNSFNVESLENDESTKADRTPTMRSKPSRYSFGKTPSFISFNSCKPIRQAQAQPSTRPAANPSQSSQQLPPPPFPSNSTCEHPVQSISTSHFLAQTSSAPSVAPFRAPAATNPSWLTSMVKTPSKLQFSFVPTLSSNTSLPENSQNLSPTVVDQRSCHNINTNFSNNNHASPSHVIKQPEPAVTPQYIKRKRDFERTFLQSPQIRHDTNGQKAESIQGEARIFHQSQQTISILNGMNGQSWSHLQDQSFPNQSFGLEFSSPVGIKDWSILHSPSVTNKNLQDKFETNSNQMLDTNVTEEAAQNQMAAQLSSNTLTERAPPGDQPSTKDGSLFEPCLSQINPLPHFSPFRVPHPRHLHSDNQVPMQSTLRCEDSPLAVRAKRREGEAGKVNILAQSILRPRSPQEHHVLSTVELSEADSQDKSISRLDQSQVPDRLKCTPDVDINLNSSPLSPSSILPSVSLADATVYMTPDVSFEQDGDLLSGAEAQNEIILLDQTQGHQKYFAVNQIRDSLSTSGEIDLHARYRILASLAQNLTQDLSIKNQMIQELQTDRDQAHNNREETERKMTAMREKLQDAVLEEKSKRDQQVQKISTIVQSLTSEIETVMSKCDITCSEDSTQLSLQEVSEFQTRLKSGKVAMENFQQILGDFQNSNNDLEIRNVQQANQIEAYEKELIMLRQQVSNPQQKELVQRKESGHQSSPASNDKQGNDHSGFSEVFPTSAHQHQSKIQETAAALKTSKVAHEREVTRLKIEIEELSNKLSAALLHDQDLGNLKQNIHMLEEEAKSRMDSLSELRSKSRSLQHELEKTKSALQAAEKDRSQALDELEKMREELDSVHKIQSSEQQAYQAKLTESRNKFNLDRTELMSKLKTSNQHNEELRVELGKLKSVVCQDCESKEIRSSRLEEERNRLQVKMSEMKAQSADKEVQIVRLRKTCSELKIAIEGLNIALQAKQQENSYLKRDRLVRQSDLTGPSLSTSTRTSSSRNTTRKISGTTVQGTANSTEQKTLDPSQPTNNPKMTKSTSEKRDMLSSITNISKRNTFSNLSESTLTNSTRQKQAMPLSKINSRSSAAIQSGQNAYEQHQVDHQADQLPRQQVRPDDKGPGAKSRVRRTPSFILASNDDQLKNSHIRANNLSRTSSYKSSFASSNRRA